MEGYVQELGRDLAYILTQKACGESRRIVGELLRKVVRLVHSGNEELVAYVAASRIPGVMVEELGRSENMGAHGGVTLMLNALVLLTSCGAGVVTSMLAQTPGLFETLCRLLRVGTTNTQDALLLMCALGNLCLEYADLRAASLANTELVQSLLALVRESSLARDAAWLLATITYQH